MNYYRRYVGDYLRDTARLSVLEHGAYGLLLDYYYAEETPIPLDLDEVCRMVRAMRQDERKAVEKILAIYFKQEADGYHQKRVDEEIHVSTKARENGGKGGRPKTGSRTEDITGSITGSETDDDTETITGSGHPPTTNHQPLTSNTKPPTKPSAPSEKISLNAGFEWQGITDERKALWAKAYPAVNLETELASMAAWAMENPANAKSNWGRFIAAWLKRSQDRAPAKGGGKSTPEKQTVACEYRGTPFNPEAEPCGLPHATVCSDYSDRKVCSHHRRTIEEMNHVRSGMPVTARDALAGLGHLRKTA